MRLPRVSLAEPRVWLYAPKVILNKAREGKGRVEEIPSVRLGSSVDMPPEGETFRGPSLPTVWEASLSAAAWSLRAAASVCWSGG